MSSSDPPAAIRRATGRNRCADDGSPRRSPLAVLVAALLVAGALAGCGFRLRGDVTYPFASLYVNAPSTPPLALELRRTLENGGATRVVASAADAQVVLDVTSVVDDKGVLSLSSGGRVREYLLTKRVSFNVHDSAGRDWLPASEFSIRRSYTFNESEVLARNEQELRLLKEMQTDAVQQIVRRLQAAKQPAT
jgi:LPS-assembly lipoprotein